MAQRRLNRKSGIIVRDHRTGVVINTSRNLKNLIGQKLNTKQSIWSWLGNLNYL